MNPNFDFWAICWIGAFLSGYKFLGYPLTITLYVFIWAYVNYKHKIELYNASRSNISFYTMGFFGVTGLLYLSFNLNYVGLYVYLLHTLIANVYLAYGIWLYRDALIPILHGFSEHKWAKAETNTSGYTLTIDDRSVFLPYKEEIASVQDDYCFSIYHPKSSENLPLKGLVGVPFYANVSEIGGESANIIRNHLITGEERLFIGEQVPNYEE